jgi:two-component system alkaline phosphatase synthesis response regulator PhoP
MSRVLVIEDENNMSASIKDSLEFEGYETIISKDGKDGLACLNREGFDSVVLDISLPEIDGYEVLREFRKINKETPVILISGRTNEEDKVFGFNLGADDYLTKPFSIIELVARVRAHIRRTHILKGTHLLKSGSYPGYEPVTIKIGEALVFLDKMTVKLEEKEAPLTPKELGIIRLLYKNRGKVVSRDMMMKEIWGEDIFVTERVIDTNVVSIRKKIGDIGRKSKYIKTIFGIGYKLAE